MAKSKHARALFEVMARQRALGSRTGSSSSGVTLVPPEKTSAPSPKWWFKSRTAADVKTIAPGEPVTGGASADAAAPFDPTQRAEAAPRAVAEVVTPPLTSSVEVPQPGPVGQSRVQPVAMEVDADKQQISLRLSYTSALIGGFGVFIALGLCVLIGKGLSRGPAPALANTSTAQLRKNPPTPGVMQLQRRQQQQTASADKPAEEFDGAGARPVNSVSTGTRAAQPTYNEPRPPATFFTDDPHRIQGLNYAIIQAYPPKEKEMAEKAAAFLVSNGVPCTIEREVPGWPTSWKEPYILVGIRGFDSKVKNNAAVETYKKQILQVSAKFTNGRSGFKSFEPHMCQWRKGS